MARLTGSAWEPLAAGVVASVGQRVRALAPFDDGTGPSLFVAGGFTEVSGAPANAIARWTAPGTPAILKIPSAAPFNLNHPASRSVDAAGAPVLTYQWRKNQVPIAGATSATLTIASVVQGDAGSYDVVVTNPCGSTTTQPVSIDVLACSVALTQPSGSGSIRIANSLGVPGAAYFTAMSFGAEYPTIAWNGLEVGPNELLTEFLFQAPPFVGTFDGGGASQFVLGSGGVPPQFLRLPLRAVTVTYDPQTLQVTGHSNTPFKLVF